MLHNPEVRLRIERSGAQITGTVKPFKNTLTLLRAIAIGMAIDSTNNFLGAYYASSGILKVHTAVIFVGETTPPIIAYEMPHSLRSSSSCTCSLQMSTRKL